MKGRTKISHLTGRFSDETIAHPIWEPDQTGEIKACWMFEGEEAGGRGAARRDELQNTKTSTGGREGEKNNNDNNKERLVFRWWNLQVMTVHHGIIKCSYKLKTQQRSEQTTFTKHKQHHRQFFSKDSFLLFQLLNCAYCIFIVCMNIFLTALLHTEPLQFPNCC